MNKINKRIYIYLIRKKLKTLGFTLVTITNIEQPDFVKDDNSLSPFMMSYGTSPFLSIYKQVRFEDTNNNQYDCIVAIKKLFFIIIGVKYYFNS